MEVTLMTDIKQNDFRAHTFKATFEDNEAVEYINDTVTIFI